MSPDVIATLVDAALKGALVIALAAAATFALRRRSAALRHAIWGTAIVVQLLLPLLALVTPAWNVPLASAPSWLVSARRSSDNAVTTGRTPPTKSCSPAALQRQRQHQQRKQKAWRPALRRRVQRAA